MYFQRNGIAKFECAEHQLWVSSVSHNLEQKIIIVSISSCNFLVAYEWIDTGIRSPRLPGRLSSDSGGAPYRRLANRQSAARFTSSPPEEAVGGRRWQGALPFRLFFPFTTSLSFLQCVLPPPVDWFCSQDPHRGGCLTAASGLWRRFALLVAVLFLGRSAAAGLTGSTRGIQSWEGVWQPQPVRRRKPLDVVLSWGRCQMPWKRPALQGPAIIGRGRPGDA
jgi:hypothetical protein